VRADLREAAHLNGLTRVDTEEFIPKGYHEPVIAAGEAHEALAVRASRAAAGARLSAQKQGGRDALHGCKSLDPARPLLREGLTCCSAMLARLGSVSPCFFRRSSQRSPTLMPASTVT